MAAWLTSILAHAVPEVCVESVKVVRGPSLYWILVEPHHNAYWVSFKAAHPHWRQVARMYRPLNESLIADEFCPEFATMEDLFNWLFDVLKLTQGERKLLLLCEGYKGCLGF